ncbi:MAG: glycosyltransferase family 39 protein [Planctomycetes bacterium]|nr:glycosyltransferase family 39 protein [Planctomycetota bacterium]
MDTGRLADLSQGKPSRYHLRWLLLILLLAVGVRVGALVAASDARLVLDERSYVKRAEALLDGQGFVGSYQTLVRHPVPAHLSDLPQYPGALQPPGYVVFLAGVMALTGRSILAVKIAQVLLGTAAVGLVYALGANWFDRRRGLVAAAICALYPNLIAFTHYLWSETLFIVLLLAVIWLLTRRTAAPTILSALVAGTVLGYAACTRAGIVYFLPLLILWMVIGFRPVRRRNLVAAAALLVGLVEVIGVWSLRNYRVHGGFVLIDTNGPLNLWRGNAPGAFADRSAERSYDPPFASIPISPVGTHTARTLVNQAKDILQDDQPTDLEIAAVAKRLAWEHIRSDPIAFGRRAWFKTIDMWNPTSFLVRHFKFQAYGPVSPAIESAICVAAMVGYVMVMLAGAVGGFVARRDPRVWLVFSLVFYYGAIHAVVFGLTRFRLPLMPLIILLAAHALCLLWPRLGRGPAARGCAAEKLDAAR